MNYTILQLVLKVSLLVILLPSMHASDTKYRLDTPIYPSAYTIQITPYFDTGDYRSFTFDGEVNITLSTKEKGLKQIKLHSAYLIFSLENTTVSSSSGQIQVSSIEFDQVYEFVYLNLTSELVANTIYYLHISYNGQILEELKGFYRSSYVENNVTKWLGATQMQPTSARLVFPCFDEPAYKATFVIIIDRPQSFQPSLANTKLRQRTIKLNNGRVRETFYPTPRMSTYLVAFLVSEFEAGYYSADNGEEFGIWARPEAAEQAAWAMDVGTRILDALSNFTGIDYYSTNKHIKLDHVALPDFESGGMENWGLVNYRESALMYHPRESSVKVKQEVARMLAHESAHLWFGDLVTCHWWSDTWLNEGFATYFEDKMVELVEPSLGLDDLVIDKGFAVDENPDEPASAMTNNDVNSPSEIQNHFKDVTYKKASSVINMIQHWIGMDAFKHGLNSYLNDRKFNVSRPENLYEHLQSSADLFGSLAAFPDHKIDAVMNSWVTTPGYPVVNVDVDFHTKTITIVQQQYSKTPENNFSSTYSIPISYTTESIHDFQNTTPVFIFDGKSHSFIDENLEQGWLIFNIQQTGHYRVNYNTHLWDNIAMALKGKNRTNIHSLNRAQIVDDLFALKDAHYVSYDTVLNVLEFLAEETEYAPWTAAIAGFTKLRLKCLSDPQILAILNKFILNLMKNVLETVGYKETSAETDLIKRHRMQILEYACELGHAGCVKHATELFDGLRKNNTLIPPNSRLFSYCTALKEGDAEDYQLLWDRYLASNVDSERIVIFDTLACSLDKGSIEHYLGQVLHSPNYSDPYQDLMFGFSSALRNYENFNTVTGFLEKINETTVHTAYMLTNIHTNDDLLKVVTLILKSKVFSTKQKLSVLDVAADTRLRIYEADTDLKILKQCLSLRTF